MKKHFHLLKWGALMAVALVGTGCANNETQMDHTAMMNHMWEQSKSCDFRIQRNAPADDYVPVGFVQLDSKPGGGQWITPDSEEFKKSLVPQVCSAGGNLAVTKHDRLGRIYGVAVFKRRTADYNPNRM